LDRLAGPEPLPPSGEPIRITLAAGKRWFVGMVHLDTVGWVVIFSTLAEPTWLIPTRRISRALTTSR
jgi:hypothetical protein